MRQEVPGHHARLAADVEQTDGLARAKVLSGCAELAGGPGGRRGGVVFLQAAAEGLADDQFLQRHTPGTQVGQSATQQGTGSQETGGEGGCIRSAGQELEQFLLHPRDERRGVAASKFNAAHLDLAALEQAKVAVGDRDAGIAAGGEEGHPAVDAVQGDGEAGAIQDEVQQGLESSGGGTAGLFDPHTIHVHVQDLETQVLGGLLGAQQDLPAIGSDGLMGLDAPKAGVLVPQVAETGDQQPFVG